MLLALDAGNSNITIGAFEGRDLVFQWRLRTVHEQTADEWGILLRNLFSPAGLDIAKVEHHPPGIERFRSQGDQRPAVVAMQMLAFAFVIQKTMAITEIDFARHVKHAGFPQG